MSHSSLHHRITEYAFEAGCDAVGITTAEPCADAARALADRRQAGQMGTWDPGAERAAAMADPRSVLPGARSVICVAVSYLGAEPEQTAPVPGSPRGTIARMAWGRDYHHIVRDRLLAIGKLLRRELGRDVQMQALVDTRRLLDRPFAHRAGLGWFGRQGMVINPRLGSWTVLGQLLVDLELDPDALPAGSCADCGRCLEACPTGAVVAPGVVDARRCLSAATQMPGIIPPSLRTALGARIYGCDVCQEACAANREAQRPDRPEFRPAPGLGGTPELIPLLNISAARFRARIAPTGIGWLRRTRIRRNAAVALGNSNDPAAVPALADALSDAEPTIRAHAAWALGRLGGAAARAALGSAHGREDDPQVLSEIESALEAGAG